MKTEPYAFALSSTRIESTRRREGDETPLLPPRIPITRTSSPPARPELDAARRRIEHLEIVLRESRVESQRLKLEVSALQRVGADSGARPARPPLGLGIAALVAGTLVGFAAGAPFVAVVAGLGTFSAIVFARWLEGVA